MRQSHHRPEVVEARILERAHKTERLHVKNPVPARIDKKMRPLMEACWDAGLRTVFCCEGDEGAKDRLAYIVFGSMLECAFFVAFAGPTQWNMAPKWTRASRDDAAFGWRIEGETVRFPTEDIPLATGTLRERKWTVDAVVRMYSQSFLLQEYGEHVGDSEMPAPMVRRCANPDCRRIISPSRRRDAIYCCRRCQLKVRDRSKRKGEE